MLSVSFEILRFFFFLIDKHKAVVVIYAVGA